jgi:hypothetical protein
MRTFLNLSLALSIVAMLVVCNTKQTAAQAQGGVKKPVVPGEQAPPANPGQNNFGGPRPATGTGATPAVRPPRPEPQIQTVSLDEISMSDPYIYPDEKSRTYYLTGTGGRLYKSKDLKMWTGPYPIIDLTRTWMDGHFVAAAENHRIGNGYYYAGTWSDHANLIENVPRRYNVPTNQTQLLAADSPEGPFKPLAADHDFCLGPQDWDIIDATMAYMPLSKDLTHRTAEPTTIFRQRRQLRSRHAVQDVRRETALHHPSRGSHRAPEIAGLGR